MSIYHILYNPKAASGNGLKKAEALKKIISEGKLHYHDITTLNIREFFKNTSKEDKVVVSGGDGTLSRFVNDIHDDIPDHEILYHAAGSGNDFAKDIDLKENTLTSLRPYIKKLPTVFVKGKDYKFINGVGYGIDGYCCEEGDKLSEKGKKINYTAIAIKGLLLFYKRTKATITVDGVTKSYTNVWMMPTMFGRYYGGGMMACPDQARLNEDGSVSLMAVHSRSKLRTLLMFPKIFTGKHINVKGIIDIFNGHEITVSFDKPTALQIDGETIKNVLSYTVKSAKALSQEHSDIKEVIV